jgi:hypothetical protein
LAAAVKDIPTRSWTRRRGMHEGITQAADGSISTIALIERQASVSGGQFRCGT